jgi:hypothetical protein
MLARAYSPHSTCKSNPCARGYGFVLNTSTILTAFTLLTVAIRFLMRYVADPMCMQRFVSEDTLEALEANDNPSLRLALGMHCAEVASLESGDFPPLQHLHDIAVLQI